MTRFLFPLLFLVACSPGGTPSDKGGGTAEPSLDVQTIAASKQTMPVWAYLTGSVIAERQVQVAADANGVVIETRVERGDTVKKGQVLALVDTRTASLNATAGTAQAAATKAQLEAADAECERAEKLFKDGVISKAQYDRTLAQCTAQRASLAAATASAQIARTTLAKSRIVAPFDGVVGDRMVEVGAFVGASSPVVSLYAPGSVRIRFAVPESLVGAATVGKAIAFRTVSGVEGEASLRFLAPALREQTRDLMVEAVVDVPPPGMLPGMTVELRLPVEEKESVVVPSTAIRSEGSVHTVFLVDQGRAIAKVVRLGSEVGGKVAVLSDLAADAQLIDTPPAELRDGQRVE